MWTIYGKEVVCLGDRTTHGGEVVTAAEHTFYGDNRVARQGDRVTCPKCGGTQTIVTGAKGVSAEGKNIALDGDLVSCGAQLIAGSGLSPVQGFSRAPREEQKAEPIPGRGLTKAEYCQYSKALHNSQVFKDTMKHMAELTKKNNVEYSCWFVQDPDGTIRPVNLRTDDGELWVDPGDRPEGAIGQVHSHTRSTFPSEQDYYYISRQPIENRPYVYGVVNTDGQVWMLDDNGEDLVCK